MQIKSLDCSNSDAAAQEKQTKNQHTWPLFNGGPTIGYTNKAEGDYFLSLFGIECRCITQFVYDMSNCPNAHTAYLGCNYLQRT